ncbi:MAG: SelT/SelW/SelH family protein [Halofilum sp. (in: g-proteobacteria)]|nr:SelT/SelW/SelH family protein [Halofilum sp. (in: g-proteobacteria)]
MIWRIREALKGAVCVAGARAQELLSTFEEELGEVALRPAGKGVFEITTGDGTVLWSRKAEGRFPEAKEIKQRLRDHIAPDRALGHADTPHRE